MGRTRKSKTQLRQSLFPPHHNHYLFSDHYLEEILPLELEWRDPQGLNEAFDKLKALYDQVREELPKSKEKVTEKIWIQPVLDILGHAYQIAPSLPTAAEGVKEPDYAFFASDEKRKKAFFSDGKPSYWPQSVAVGDAKRWDLFLDRKSTGKSAFENTNPNFQIDYYLRATQRRWGILTNGRLWRLYNQEKSFALNVFYEVNLPELLGFGTRDDFKYFFLFFRKQAFLPDRKEECFLDRAYSGSATFATRLGVSLREQVYRALLVFVKGGLAHPANKLNHDRDLKLLHDNALIFLYRLIFVLYAESRELLPLDNEKYCDGVSLQALKSEVAQKLDSGQPYDSLSTRLWGRLKRLFKMIDTGNKSFGVAPYNGGLFKRGPPDGHSFLENVRLGDPFVAGIIDLLSRTRGQHSDSKVFVDYRSLGVRQLGTIYEGLLEFQVRVATEPMVAVKHQGKEVVISASEAKGRRVLHEYQRGELYAVNDRGERKATGSYFTPEYVVEYIVKNTIGSLIKGKSAQEILSKRFLDPAMGSGHFLVQIIDFVAHTLINCNDVYDFLPVDEQDEIGALKRLVVERCVYGVDSNPLAVELAKLSLWLTCVAKDKPLSFLNHHLRCGDSLVGAWLRDLRSLPSKKKADSQQQPDLFRSYFTQDVCKVLSGFKLIEDLPSDTIRNIHKKEEIWDQIRGQLRPYERIADLWVSTFFGNEKVDDAVYRDTVAAIRRGGGLLPKTKREEVLLKAHQIAKEKRFFHWEVGFPEAFFDEFGRELEDEKRGFDAVVGNPPYVKVTSIRAELRKYVLRRFETAVGRFDLYIIFAEQALSVLRKGGMFGFIQPIKFVVFANGKQLRELLLEQTQIQSIADVSQSDVFPDPSTYPCIPVVKKCAPPGNHRLLAVQVPSHAPELINNINDKGVEVVKIPQSRFLQTPQHIMSLRLSDRSWSLVKQIEARSFLLEDVFRIEQCIRIGSENKRKRLVFDTGRFASASQEIRAACRRMLDGGNIQRYAIVWDGLRLHYLPDELYNPKSLEMLETKKVLVKRIAPSLTAVPDLGADGEFYYPLNTIYALIARGDTSYSPFYITSVLNSRLPDWYYKLLFEAIAIRGGYIEYREYLKYLPIPRIHFTTTAAERQKLLQGLTAQYERNDEARILAMVAAYLPKAEKGGGLPTMPTTTGAGEKPDVVHDFMSFLADRMIALHKERREKADEFTSWLKEIKGIDTNSLKSVLKELWNRDEKGLAKALKAKKMHPSPSDWDEIKHEFSKCHDELVSISTSIDATDHLIDQIVYRLYGLTPDQIKLVEDPRN